MLLALQSCIDRLLALVVPAHPAWSEDVTRRGRVVAGMCVGLFFFDLLVIVPVAVVADERAATMVPALVAVTGCYPLELLLLRRSRSPASWPAS